MKLYIWLCFALALLVGCRQPSEAPVKPAVDATRARPQLADIPESVRAPALVFARQQANISARLTAPIRKLLAGKGSRVAAGQLLAELDQRDLVAQREEAEAALTDAEANLQKGSAGTLPSDIERARGQAATTEAALRQAQKIYDRRRHLFEQGAIPQRELLVSETDLAQARANYEVATRTLDLLRNQSRDKEILMAKSRAAQARARLAWVRAQLEFAEIRSPFDGAITEQFLYPGDMARPDQPLFTVVDLSAAIARAQIPDAEAAAVRPGQACTFTSSDGGGASQGGRITVVNQAVDPARRTIEAWCEIPNPRQTLRAGQFGQVTVITGVIPKSIVVPVAAVQFVEGASRSVVMVAGETGLALKREVETGQIFDGKVQVSKGLQAGEAVIIEGAYGLQEGTRIHVVGDRAR